MAAVQPVQSGTPAGNIAFKATGSNTARTLADRFAAEFHALDFGARADGTADDTAAIQAAIDAAHSAGGGVVRLPRGTYKVKPSGLTPAIGLRDNVAIEGDGPNSVLLVDPTSGTYASVIGFAPGVTRVSHVAIRNLKVDTNGANNTTARIDSAGVAASNSILALNSFDDVTIEGCWFEQSGVWTATLYSGGTGTAPARVRIANNAVRFTRGASDLADYDNTAFYVEAPHQVISGNRGFVDDLSVRAHGFIETHNGLSTVTGNITDGYQTAVSVVANQQSSEARTNSDVTVSGNTISRCNLGIRLWSLTGRTIRGLTVSGNTIGVNQVDWDDASSCGVSAVYDPTGLQGGYEGVTIANNTIVFQDEGDGRSTYDNASGSGSVDGSRSNGIGFLPYGDVTGLNIVGNTIVRAPGNGISVGNDSTRLPDGNVTRGVRIAGNTLIDPGQNKGLNNGYRVGIRLAATLWDVACEDNSIVSTNASALSGYYDLWTGTLGGGRIGVRMNRSGAASGAYTKVLDNRIDQSLTIGDLSVSNGGGITGNSVNGNAIIGNTRIGIGVQANQNGGSNIPSGNHAMRAVRTISGTATVPATTDVLRVEDGSITSGTNSGRLIGAGVSVNGVGYVDKFVVDLAGNVTAAGAVSATTATFTAIPEAADDAAAALAGVPVGGLYRNGSALMIRQS